MLSIIRVKTGIEPPETPNPALSRICRKAGNGTVISRR